ncbi:MAG: hypothetical protein KAF91_26585 [Nostoc sp. TH1S01]|nr:hypothetical protein [Nostoc sp. TH1S01]
MPKLVTQTIQEIGGGLNFKRPKFLQIIPSCIAGELKSLYVAHKNRLCRFGFDLVEQIVLWGGGNIIVANAETLSPHEELTQDKIQLFTVLVHDFTGYANINQK